MKLILMKIHLKLVLLIHLHQVLYNTQIVKVYIYIETKEHINWSKIQNYYF